jgi:Zn-dependent peptidase ImmA (M78 family)
MSDTLNIDFKWLSYPQSSPLERAFAAEIGLALSGQWMTELEELESRTTMTHVRACAHTLAVWLGGNWWRLRWEPEPRNARDDADWRIAHSVASAGGGFAWPNVIFASDGESLAVASIPRLKAEAFEPLRYLNPVRGRITAAEFETKVDAFMEAMISRHRAMGINDTTLPLLWSEVREERADPVAARWRKLEALCGYDPDEAPAALIETLAEDTSRLGDHAMEEVAAHGRHQTAELLQSIEELASVKGHPRAGGFRCKPQVLKKKPSQKPGLRPWERAALLAQAARKEWNLGNEPISNMSLADLLQTGTPAFKDHAVRAATPMPLAVRHADGEKADVYVGSSWMTTRRFAASRLLGHWLDRAGETDRLIPAAEGRTADQQFQRAFAQEFLCPFNALMERLQTQYPTGDEIEDAADYFGVSQQVVRTTLVNKGELDRDALDWSGKD